MMKLIALFCISFFCINLYSQKRNVGPETMNSCTGAINIFENGNFNLQFTGNKNLSIIDQYSSLSNIETENQLWCSYIAPKTGVLTFDAKKRTGILQAVIFTQIGKDICGEISNGVAEIERLFSGKENAEIGLSHDVRQGYLYALELNEGDKIQILFATDAKSTDEMFLQWEFKEKVATIQEIKIVDQRNDDFAPTFSILVRDKITNKPLIAQLSIEGSKGFDALYTGSDFLFNVDRNCEILIKCDVEGYFFMDLTKKINALEQIELIMPMVAISKGHSIQIEEIEFKPGTSEIVLSSEPKLNRLKDFLALNSDLNVEIQGHVFAIGDNTFSAQKVSEARAKRVMHYLISNGIAKERLTAVGFGNTKPIFAKPQFFYEEQANRRVEVLVK